MTQPSREKETRRSVPVHVERLADWLCWNGWGMRLNDPEMAEGVREDWRNDARKALADLGVDEVGIDYCLVHSGTHNEDESKPACDWWDRDPEQEDAPCEFVPLLYFGRGPASDSELSK